MKKRYNQKKGRGEGKKRRDNEDGVRGIYRGDNLRAKRKA